MEIEQQEFKRSYLFRVRGRIDSSTAPEFEKALLDKIKEGHANIIVEMSGVEYLSSAALRALIAAQKETGGRRLRPGKVVLADLPDHIREVFDLAALNSLFEFYDSETEAVGSF